MCHTVPRSNWTHAKDGPRMCNGINPLTGKEQSLYFPEDYSTMPGWFKGMEEIIKVLRFHRTSDHHHFFLSYHPLS